MNNADCIDKGAVKIEGKKVFLRPVGLSDVTEKYARWLNDPQVNQFLETRFTVQSVNTIEDYVRRMMNDPGQKFFAICTTKEGVHIGNIKLGPIKKQHGTADISLFIGEKDQWGKGCASEAIYLLSKYAFDELKLRKLKAGCYSNNVGSRKAFEKTGYRLEGRLTDFINFNGQFVDHLLLTCDAQQLRPPRSLTR